MLSRLAQALALFGQASLEAIFRLMHHVFVDRIFSSSLPSAVAGNEHGFDILIEFVEQDVGKHGGDDRTLRDSAQCPIELPVLQISGIKQMFHQPNEASIMDFLFQH